MPSYTFVVKIQRELCHPKCAQKFSGLLRNGPLKKIPSSKVENSAYVQQFYNNKIFK